MNTGITTFSQIMDFLPMHEFRKYVQRYNGKVHDVNILDELVPEPGSVYVMDRGYLDFARLYTIHLCFGKLCYSFKKSQVSEALLTSH